MAKMKHPNSSTTIDADPQRVAMYESQGWVKVTASKTAKKAAAKVAADIKAQTPVQSNPESTSSA